MLELGDRDRAVPLGDADRRAKVANRLRGIATPPQPGDRGHARVVPAADVAAVHQLSQDPLAQNRVAQVEPGELDLLRMTGHIQLIEHPVVERTMVFELQRAE